MRQEVYRVAYDEASAELSEILGRFEQLRLRKDRVEKVVEALKPLVASEAAAEPKKESSERPHEVSPLHSPSESVQSTPSPIPYPVQQPSMAPSDPFARRESASANSSKDVSEYSRLFNTGTSR